jgi:hypothetical protein
VPQEEKALPLRGLGARFFIAIELRWIVKNVGQLMVCN